MPRNPAKKRCTFPNCHAWALRGGELCAPHAGHVRVARKPPAEILAAPQPKAEELHETNLEQEIRFLATKRDQVAAWLQARMQGEDTDAGQVLRYLAVLAQVGKSLAGMLVQRASLGGAGELERFFDAVADRVRALQPKGED